MVKQCKYIASSMHCMSCERWRLQNLRKWFHFFGLLNWMRYKNWSVIAFNSLFFKHVWFNQHFFILLNASVFIVFLLIKLMDGLDICRHMGIWKWTNNKNNKSADHFLIKFSFKTFNFLQTFKFLKIFSENFWTTPLG